ncbi:hypothetical protein EMIT0P228_90089 [Pseudomonas brassicacearum]
MRRNTDGCARLQNHPIDRTSMTFSLQDTGRKGELVRDATGLTCDVECAAVFASKLAPTVFCVEMTFQHE